MIAPQKASNISASLSAQEMNCLRLVAAVVSSILLIASVNRRLEAGNASEWHSLSPGLDLKLLLKLPDSSSDASITVLRIDPKLWELRLVGTSLSGTQLGSGVKESSLQRR
jgi:hypothetical protein